MKKLLTIKLLGLCLLLTINYSTLYAVGNLPEQYNLINHNAVNNKLTNIRIIIYIKNGSRVSIYYPFDPNKEDNPTIPISQTGRSNIIIGSFDPKERGVNTNPITFNVNERDQISNRLVFPIFRGTFRIERFETSWWHNTIVAKNISFQPINSDFDQNFMFRIARGNNGQELQEYNETIGTLTITMELVNSRVCSLICDVCFSFL